MKKKLYIIEILKCKIVIKHFFQKQNVMLCSFRFVLPFRILSKDRNKDFNM